MNQPLTMQFEVTPDVILQLGRSYGTNAEAGAELVFNGIDSAQSIDRDPVIHVRLYNAGEHPVLGNSCGIGIQDNGSGFTTDVMNRYVRVGDSARIGHGRHGVGKLAALQLCDQTEKRFFIISRREQGAEVILWEMLPKIFANGTVTGIVFTGALPYKTGNDTFSEIVIPFSQEPFTTEEFRRLLQCRLSLFSKWTVIVDGVKVTHRKMPSRNMVDLRSEKKVRHFGDGLRACIGKPEIGALGDAICLIDATTGRTVVEDIGSLHKRRRDMFPPIFFEPLNGAIFIPGLEDWSSTDRQSLTVDFWKDRSCSVIMNWLHAVVAPEIEKLIGKKSPKQRTAEEAIREDLDIMEKMFDRTFGSSSIADIDELMGGTMPGGKPSSGAHPRKPADPNPNPSDRPGTGPTRNPPTPTERREAVMKVEDKSYRIRVVALEDPNIAFQMRSGNMIVINRSYAGWQYYSTQATVDVRRHWLVNLIFQAHVQETRSAADVNLFNSFHSLWAQVHPDNLKILRSLDSK